MSNYSTDIFTWAQEQAELLRRLAAGEQSINEAIDWDNVIDEIETVGRSELKAVTPPLANAMQHKLHLLGWPNSPAVQHWQAEVRIFLTDVIEEFKPSMRAAIEAEMDSLYRRARVRAERHMIDEPPAAPLPATCPWSFDELLAQAKDVEG
jgi:Domain of unknown function DUF29